MKWTKELVPIHANGVDLLEAYSSKIGDSKLQVVSAGEVSSRVFGGHEVNHLVVSKFRYIRDKQVMEEPDYSLKYQIIKELGKWNANAIEVMPPESQLVDDEDVYHLWEVQYLRNFIADVTPIFRGGSGLFNLCFGEIKYYIESIHGIRYIFFQNRDRVKWKEKQALKNYVMTLESTAVEVISEDMLHLKYGCLICLPSFTTLDFGIRPTC